ncbi:phosphatidylinositol 4-kinase gamma [Trifolium repens]|nr:phosphatidylinositol 4-kinase gamma [Trifolium repens]
MLAEKEQKHSGEKPENGYSVYTLSGHRSANEQLPTSIRFVKLAYMTEDEWTFVSGEVSRAAVSGICEEKIDNLRSEAAAEAWYFMPALKSCRMNTKAFL